MMSPLHFPALVLLLAALLFASSTVAWSLSSSDARQSRRAFVVTSSTAAAATVLIPLTPLVGNAFDGSGSSSYSGRTPLEKAAKAKGYRDRIVQDVKDFNRLGSAISQGTIVDTESDAWVAFFIPYQRRQADAVGRTYYAALLDLIGVEKSGGAALLLAATYAKQNKPPQNLPQYKKADGLVRVFDPIKAAGQAGDAARAQKEWSQAAVALSDFLESVELPSDLKDPLYN